MALERLIDALRDPAAYPDPADRVEVRQTHISVVFLAGGPGCRRVPWPLT